MECVVDARMFVKHAVVQAVRGVNGLLRWCIMFQYELACVRSCHCDFAVHAIKFPRVQVLRSTLRCSDGCEIAHRISSVSKGMHLAIR